jgi:autotransporter-associated beta strand protein
MIIRRCALLSLSCIGLAAATVQAANIWDGGGSDDNWGTAANWDNNTVPTFASGTLTFAGATRTTSNNEAASRTVAGITFDAAASAFTLSGSAITLGGNVGFTAAPAAPITQTINFDMAMSGGRTFSSSAGGNGSLVVNGVISGGFGISKGQLGSLTLNGTNSFSGTLSITAGSVIASTIAGSGTSSAIGSGSTIALGGAAGATATALTYIGTATAPITVNRAVTLPSTNSNAGGTITNNGSGPLVFNGSFTNSGTSGTKSFTLGGTNAGTNDYQSAIANGAGGGAVAFIKTGSGIWILSGANTYTGTTGVVNGTLLVNGTNSGLGATSVAAAGALGGSGKIAGAVTVSGTLSPGSDVGVISLGSVVLGGSTMMEINATTRGTGYDGVTIDSAGSLNYGGILALAFGNGLAFAGTDVFDLFQFTSGSSAGSFTSLTSTGFYAGTWTDNLDGTFTLPNVGPGNQQSLTFTQSTGDVTITIVPEPATMAVVGGCIAAARWVMRRRRGGVRA